MQPDHSPSPRPDAVIFDLDGTLVDTVGTRIAAWLRVFSEFGIPSSRDQLAPLIGIDGRRLAREVAAAGGAPIDDPRAEEIDRRAGEIYGELNIDPRPLPGAAELLTALVQRGIRWAVATSSRREQVAASVSALGLPHGPTVVDGSHVEHAKPAPDLLLLAAVELDLEPGRCWYVGDSTWDMAAAADAGMLPVAVLAGAAVGEEALLEAGAALVVPTLDKLLVSLE